MKNLKSLLVLVLLFCIKVSLTAQTPPEPIPLKSFEGYYSYQFQAGTDSYINITATETGLKLKQMWDGKEIHFRKKSGLEFEGVAGYFPLKFTKEENGKITEVLAFSKDLWKRNDNYKPVTQTYEATTKELNKLIGSYQLRPDQRYVQFYVEGGSLIAKQMWDQKLHHMLAQSPLKFISQEAGITVTFVKGEDGNIVSAELSTGGILDKVNESGKE